MSMVRVSGILAAGMSRLPLNEWVNFISQIPAGAGVGAIGSALREASSLCRQQNEVSLDMPISVAAVRILLRSFMVAR